MEKEKLNNLKLNLREIIIKQNELSREKNKKEKDSKDNLITRLKNNLVANFDLLEYDEYINMEIHNTNFFITDVETIIMKYEQNE